MKLKNLLLASTILGLSTFAFSVNPTYAASSSKAQVSTIFINFDSVVQGSKVYQDGLNAFKKQIEPKEEAISKREKALLDERNDLIKTKNQMDADLKKGKLTGEQLRKKEQDLQTRTQQFQQDVQKLEQDKQALAQEAQELQNKLLANVIDEVRAVVAKYAKSHNYKVVMSAKAAVYVDPSLDKTAEVLGLVK